MRKQLYSNALSCSTFMMFGPMLSDCCQGVFEHVTMIKKMAIPGLSPSLLSSLSLLRSPSVSSGSFWGSLVVSLFVPDFIGCSAANFVYFCTNSLSNAVVPRVKIFPPTILITKGMVHQNWNTHLGQHMM